MKEKRKISIEDLEKKQVFKVPDGYFEQLPELIRDNVQVQKPGFSLFPFPAVARYGMALISLCLIVVAGYFLNKPAARQVPPEQILSQVSGKEIIQYLQQTELSQYDLVEKATEADIILENKALEEVDISQDMILEEYDPELIEELI